MLHATLRQAQDRPADAPVLKLDGLVLFGGFGVMSDMPKEAIETAHRRRRAKQRDPNGSKAPEVATRPRPQCDRPSDQATVTSRRAFCSSRQRRNGTPPSTGQDGPLKPSVNWLKPIST